MIVALMPGQDDNYKNENGMTLTEQNAWSEGNNCPEFLGNEQLTQWS
jgi:hypothetical protein